MADQILSFCLTLFAGVMPISIALTNIAGAPLLLCWVFVRGAVPLTRPGSWRALEWAWIIFMGISVLSAWMGLNTRQSLHAMWKKDFYFLIALVIPALATRSSELHRMVRWYVIAGIAVAVFGLIQAGIGVDQTDIHGGLFNRLPARLEEWPRPILDILSLVNGRVRGTRSHPIHYAACLLFTLSFCLAYLLSEDRPARLAAWFLSTVVIASAVLLSYSRGPWLAMGAIGLLAAGSAFLDGRGRRAARLLIFLVPVIGFLFHLPSLRERVATMVDRRYSSNEERLHMWRVGWTLWKLDPVLGIGAGNVKVASFPFLTEDEAVGGGWGHLHNTFVNMLVERGLLGLLAYLGLLGVLLKELILALKRTVVRSYEHDLFLSALLGIVAFLLCGFTETVYNASVVSMMLWCTVGLALSAARANEA
jgi:hypothetical protein